MSGIVGGLIRDLIARIGVVVNTFDDLIDHGKAVQGLGFGLVDEFEDETGVDTVASLNEMYDAAADYYHNQGASSYTQEQLLADQNYIKGTHWFTDIYQSFKVSTTDKITKIKFLTGASSTGTVNIRIETDSAGASSGVLIAAGAKKDGVVLTSSATTEVILDIAPTPAAATTYWLRIQWVSGSAAIRNTTGNPYADGLFRFDTTDVATEDLVFGVFQVGAAANMTLFSNAQVAGVAPAKAQFTALLEAVDAIILNTDCKAYVSSDGGTTYDQATLKDYGDHGSGIAVVSGEAPLTGGGISMKWKFETLNAKEQRLRAVGVLWD